MLAAATTTQAQIVGWACFALGVVLLGFGVALGLGSAGARVVAEARRKVQEGIELAKEHVEALTSKALYTIRADPMLGTEATSAESAATLTATQAKSALDEVGTIVASLPENLRFPGLLILVGTVLIGVATIEFGGVAIF